MNNTNNNDRQYASDNQLILAGLYRYTSLGGLLIMILAFIVYASGLVPASVPVEEVRSYWHHNADDFARETGTPAGWSILKYFSRGDVISLSTLALMAVAVICCLIIMMAVFLKKNRLYALIALLQTIVLVIAASGIISGG